MPVPSPPPAPSPPGTGPGTPPGRAGAASAPPVLRPPRNRADPRALRWWTAQAWLVVSAPALLAAAALGTLSSLFFPRALPWLSPVLLAVVVLPALVLPTATARLRYAAHGWELGRHAVYGAGGRLPHRRRIAPLSRVQTVDTVRGPLQRRYGLATVTVTTASTAGDVRLAGLADADAEDLARRVAEAARALPGGTP